MKSRRSFIKKGVLGAGIPLFIPNTELFSIFKNTPSDQLNIGVVGTGARGQGLIRIINRIKGMNLISICDTLPFRLDAAALLAPKAKQYSNYKEMLLLQDLDAIIISTPLNTHASIAGDAIDASVHIYCEKTMVKGGQDTLGLLKKVQNGYEKIFQTGHQYHSSRLYSHIVDMIQAGEIGQVIAIES